VVSSAMTACCAMTASGSHPMVHGGRSETGRKHGGRLEHRSRLKCCHLLLLDPCVLTHDCCCGMHVGRHVVPIILLHVVLQLLMVKLLLVMLVLTGSRMTCMSISPRLSPIVCPCGQADRYRG